MCLLRSFFIGFFEIIANLIVPDDWTSKDASMIKMIFSACVPIMLLASAIMTGKDKKTGEWTQAGATIVYFILPMINIPVVATLFRPIVGATHGFCSVADAGQHMVFINAVALTGCNFDVEGMNPVANESEDEITRDPPIEVSFLPVLLRD